MHRNSQSVTIRHREFIGEIRGNTTFTVRDSLAINPGIARTFPWLSKIANNFQEYTIKGMVYHYIPSSGTAVSSTDAALGTVMMQTSYRATDSAPTSKLELLNEYFSSESVPSDTFCHFVECNPKENPFNVHYIRNGNVPGEDSRLMYDLGVTHIAVSGQQIADKVLGDVWVTYEVELKKPIVYSNVTPLAGTADVQYAGTMTGADWFNGTATDYGTLPVTAATRTITFPEGAFGSYLIMVMLNPTTTFSACDLSGVPVLVNCQQQALDSGGATYWRSVLGGGTPTLNRAWYMTRVLITDPAAVATVTMPSSTLTGACAQSIIWIVPVGSFLP
jgi:hypothetical protein